MEANPTVLTLMQAANAAERMRRSNDRTMGTLHKVAPKTGRLASCLLLAFDGARGLPVDADLLSRGLGRLKALVNGARERFGLSADFNVSATAAQPGAAQAQVPARAPRQRRPARTHSPAFSFN